MTQPRHSSLTPGLLPWHIAFLTLLAGLYGHRFLLPALLAALFLFLLDRMLSRFPVPIWALSLAFTAGLCTAAFLTPREDAEVMPWMLERAKVEVSGRVKSVQPKTGNRLQLVLDNVVCRPTPDSEVPLSGKLVWTWEEPLAHPGPGQMVTALLRVKPVHGMANPGGWDSGFHWRRQGVFYRAYTRGDASHVSVQGSPEPLWSLRQKLRDKLARHLGQGEGQGIVQALLLGDRSRVSRLTSDLFRQASLAHSLALSGLHLGFVVSLGWLLARLAGMVRPEIYLYIPRRKLAVCLAAPLAIVYIWLGQAAPSLLRAGFMFFFWGVFILAGRRHVLLDGLMFALVVLTVLSPLSLYDLGLQLSVVAVAGIAVVWPLLSAGLDSMLPEGRLRRFLKPPLALLGVSFTANVVLLPLTTAAFGQVSPHIMLNVVCLPVIGWVVLPLGLAGLTCLVLPGLDGVAHALLGGAGWVMQRMVDGLGYLDNAGLLDVWVVWRPTWPEAAGYWLLLFCVVVWWKSPRRLPPGILALGLGLLLLPHLRLVASALDGDVRLTLLDVGQGQSVLVEHGTRRVLIDGGGSWNRDFDVGRLVTGAPLTRGRPPRLEYVVMTHPDMDHSRGLEFILSAFDIDSFLTNGDWPAQSDGAILSRVIDRAGVPVHALEQGEVIDLGGDVRLRVLRSGPRRPGESSNDASLVFRLEADDRGLAVLPGDAEQRAIADLLAQNGSLAADVLVLPHHGSRSSVSEPLYQRVDPDLTLASAAYLHPFNFPHREVREALDDLDIPLLTTARQGAIVVTWDRKGASMRVWTMRGGWVDLE